MVVAVVLASVLFVNDAATVSVEEGRDILAQIDAGRSAVVVGGPFLANRKVRLGEKTIPLDEAERRLADIPIAHEALGPKVGWREGSWSVAPGPLTPKGGHAEPSAEGGRRFVNGGPLVQWETHYIRISPYAGDDDLLVLEVRSAYPEAQMSVELEDRAHTRWIATVELGTAWRKAVLKRDDFVRHQGPSSVLKFSEVWRLGLGVSEQYTPRMTRRLSSFEVRRLGSARNPFSVGAFDVPEDLKRIPVEGLWPSYKTWKKNGALAFFDRNDGAGHGRGAVWRQKMLGTEHEMILLERRAGRPERCVALFGYCTDEQLRRPGVRERIERTRALLENGAVLFDGGSDQFTYFPGETAKIGASWRGRAKTVVFEIAERDGKTVLRRSFAGDALAGGSVTFPWPVPPAPEGSVWRVTVTLDDGADAISHEFVSARMRPDAKGEFVTVRDGDFYLGGRKWYPVCINFWPIYSSATERVDYWGTWQKDSHYAPNLVRRNLEAFRRLGGNSISIQYNGVGCGRNVRDLYRMCRELGIRVNQSLGEASPFDRSEAQRRNLKAYFDETGAAGDATVFAYDTVWEPGNYVFREGGRGQGAGFCRDRWNRQWQAWTVEQFGSVEHAVKVWGVDPGRDGQGLLRSPPQVAFIGRENPGTWRRIMASYRRFMDNVTARLWANLRRELAALAPNQLQSFRQGNTLPHDFALTGPMRHIDFVMPEGYSFADSDADEVAMGWITRYIDAYSNRRPSLWSEFGRNAWNRRLHRADDRILAACATYTERFYRAGLAAGANGFSPWWFPGGYRVDERSDYGFMNPDCTPRAPLRTYAHWVPAILRERAKPSDPPRRVFDRDANPGGYFAAAFVERLPAEAMTIAGADLTSATAPALALGDVPLEGEMPLKYLDADFDAFACRRVGVDRLAVRAQIGNPGPATWEAAACGAGGVSLVAYEGTTGRVLARRGLDRAVPRLADTGPLEFEVPLARETGDLVFRLEATGRFRFGEKKFWRND